MKIEISWEVKNNDKVKAKKGVPCFSTCKVVQNG